MGSRDLVNFSLSHVSIQGETNEEDGRGRGRGPGNGRLKILTDLDGDPSAEEHTRH